jgi:uncharacterized membrane protein
MKKFSLWDVTALLIGLIPLAYLLLVYSSLPKIVPTHFGVDGKPNSYSNKSELFMLQGILIFVASLVYLVMKFMPTIDLKKYAAYNAATYQKLGFAIVMVFAVINFGITFSAGSQIFKMNNLILALAGLLFVFMGNLMYSIKPNYIAGIRIPWTVEDEGNWRATHHLASKLWVVGGIVVTVTRLLMPSETGLYILFSGLGIMMVVPIIYSYYYFKKHQLK